MHTSPIDHASQPTTPRSNAAPKRPFARLAAALVLTGLATAMTVNTATAANAATKTTKAPSTKSSVNPNAPEVLSAGDIPDNIAYVPYKPAAGGFTLTTPEGWSRKNIPSGAVFTDKYNIIQVETLTGQKAPTTTSVTAAVKAKNTTAKGFVFGRSTTVRRKAGTAVLTTYLVNSAPNDVTGKTIPVAVERYEFHRNGTSVVLTLSGAKGADNVDPWKIVTDSFAWS